MKCPVCVTVDLSMTERQSVEIDYCSQCRGVWLDRGELDKIIERSAAYDNDDNDGSYRQQPDRPVYNETQYPNQKRDEHYNGSYDPRKKRKRSFLGDMFDIFD
jgi:uncharacterized protein